MPLISRRSFPPGGYQFFEPRTNWHAPAGLTFEQVVGEIIRHRSANPRYRTQWSVDPTDVGNELDNYTCIRIGHDPNYCSGGAALPFPRGPGKVPSPPLPPVKNEKGVAAVTRPIVAAGKKIASGISLLIDWLGHGANPVSPEIAHSRAKICHGCTANKNEDLTSFFTIPASEFIRKQLAIRKDMDLSTPYDDTLGVCEICACPIKLKVHAPIDHVKRHLKPEIEEQLPSHCWMKTERQ